MLDFDESTWSVSLVGFPVHMLWPMPLAYEEIIRGNDIIYKIQYTKTYLDIKTQYGESLIALIRCLSCYDFTLHRSEAVPSLDLLYIKWIWCTDELTEFLCYKIQGHPHKSVLKDLIEQGRFRDHYSQSSFTSITCERKPGGALDEPFFSKESLF